VYETSLVYSIYDTPASHIVRQHFFTYTLECDIVRNNQAASHVHNEVNTHHAAFEVKNNVSIAFFTDPNFMHELPGNPVHLHVGDQVFLKVFTPMADWTIKMRLHSCFTQPFLSADESSKYYLIKDGYVKCFIKPLSH